MARAEAERQTALLQGTHEVASKQAATAQEAASQAQQQHAEQVSATSSVHIGEM